MPKVGRTRIEAQAIERAGNRHQSSSGCMRLEPKLGSNGCARLSLVDLVS